MKVSLTFTNPSSFTPKFTTKKMGFSNLFDTIEQVTVSGIDYKGDYVIIPSCSAQELETKGKLLAHNMMIEPIPLHEVSNEAGGTTITIG